MGLKQMWRAAGVALAVGLATMTALSGTEVRAAETTTADADSATNKSAMETIVHDYIMNNPEVILQSLREYQAKAQEEQQQKAQQALEESESELESDPQTPVAGNPDGDVTVVEFFDYNCGYCKRVFPSIQTMIENDGKVRYVFKEYPILSESSMTAARAALAAWNLDQDKYFDFHALLMNTRGALNEDRILDLAEKAGLDRGEIETAMANPEITAEIRQNLELGQRIGVTGTPAFVVDGKLIPGAVSLETLQEAVATAREG